MNHFAISNPIFVTMHLTTLSALAAAYRLTHAISHLTPRSSFVLKERHPVPQDWSFQGPAGKSDIIELHIGLKQRLEGAVELHLSEIADPNHARYGRHLSASDIRDLIAPAHETIDLVQEWLREHGISDEEHDFSAARDWLTVSVPVETAERMLDTAYSTFGHADGSTLLRAPEWSLPAHLHSHIDVIQPTTSFMRPRPNAVIPRDSLPAAHLEGQVIETPPVLLV